MQSTYEMLISREENTWNDVFMRFQSLFYGGKKCLSCHYVKASINISREGSGEQWEKPENSSQEMRRGHKSAASSLATIFLSSGDNLRVSPRVPQANRAALRILSTQSRWVVFSTTSVTQKINCLCLSRLEHKHRERPNELWMFAH